MFIKSADHKKLIAVTQDGDIVPIKNHVMRKRMTLKEQRILSDDSVCIVCNYGFYDGATSYGEKIKAICHPFRDISRFPKNKELFLLSESDFCDRLWVDTEPQNIKREYDFVYFTLDSAQGIKTKGFHTLPLIMEVAKEMNLKGLVIDYFDLGNKGKGRDMDYSGAAPGSTRWSLKKTRKRVGRSVEGSTITIHRGALHGPELCKADQLGKFVLFPNNRDASPRIIAESLLRGIPVLVNQNIYGGWKYVSEVNGSFYDSPFDITELDNKRDYYKEEFKKAFTHMMEKDFNRQSIIDDYHSKWGLFNSSKRLANIINKINSTDYKYVFYREFEYILKNWREHAS